MSNYLMAIDAGTGSLRSVIFDLNGNQIAVSQQEWTHNEDPRYPNSMDFDVEKNYGIMVSCVKESIKMSGINPRDIIAISSTSMREGIVLYDSDGRELWACANVDARADKEVSHLKSLGNDIEQEIYEESGQTFALGALPRVLWVKNHMPEVYEKTAAITMLNDWITYRLTGILSVEPSNGCTTGMFDLSSRSWDNKIAEKCGLKTDIYPTVYECGKPIGKILPEMASEFGLSEECLIVAGGGDANLGCIGVGVCSPGQAALFGGSFWQLEYNVDKPTVDKDCRVRVNCHILEDTWQYEMIAFFPGLIMRWFRDAFCQMEKQIAEQRGISAYSVLEEQAREVPVGSYGMMCSFSSVMDYKEWKHASPAFVNFNIDPLKFNKGTFYRALMENAALVTLGHSKIISEVTGKEIKEVTFASGASQSDLWCQIVSDVLGAKVKIPKVKEATALGTSICAGVGAGVYSSIEDAANKLVKFEKEYTPDMENHKKYLEIYNTWKEINKTQMENSDRGLISHMWKAPGL
ncbi:MAG: autoinducer-2 kinase [Clostridia bacterium]|nr:autoinducer-2 kinase [Clostridia bacterium]